MIGCRITQHSQSLVLGGEAYFYPHLFCGVLKNFASPLFTGFFLNNADVSYPAIENIGY
jgi:hypothetical protein